MKRQHLNLNLRYQAAKKIAAFCSKTPTTLSWSSNRNIQPNIVNTRWEVHQGHQNLPLTCNMCFLLLFLEITSLIEGLWEIKYFQNFSFWKGIKSIHHLFSCISVQYFILEAILRFLINIYCCFNIKSLTYRFVKKIK